MAVWVAAFHPPPRDLMRATRQYFLDAGFSPGALGENWLSFGRAGLVLAGVLAAAGWAGGRLARWLSGPRPGPAGGAPAFGAGFGLLGSAVLGLGLTGLVPVLPPWAALGGSALAAAAVCRRGLPRGGRPRPRPGAAFSRLTVAALLAAVLVCAAGVFNIEMAWDALTYHLRLPSFYAYRHKIFHVWHHYCSGFPSQVEMLYLLGLQLEGDLLARLLNASLGVLLVTATVGLARRAGVGGTVPAVLLAASPVFLLLTTRAYIDLGFALFLTLSMTRLLDWQRRGSRAALVASGLFAGWGLGSKYVGVFFLPAVLAAAWPALASARGRRAAVAWNAAALLPLAAWLVKNWLSTGNPVHPFLGGLFGVPIDLPSDLAPAWAAPGAGPADWLAVLPLAVKAMVLDHGRVDGPHLALLAGLLPLLAPRPASPALAALRRAALAYLAVWACVKPDARFLLPALPWMLVVISAQAERLAALGRAWRVGLRTVMEAGVLAAVAYTASVQWIFFAPFSMVLGFETVDTRLQLGLPPPPFTYYLREHLNDGVPPGDRILYASHFSTYYVERECLADFHFGRSHLTRLLSSAPDPGALDKRLKQLGIRWILSTGPLAAQYRGIPGYFDVPDGRWAMFKDFLATRARTAWQTERYTLFRLGAPHPPLPLPDLPVYAALAFADADEALTQGRTADALRAFADPPPLLRDVGSTHVRRGDALMGLGRVNEARDAFIRALELGSDTPRIHLGLAQIALRAGRAAEALDHAETACRQNPLSAYAAATHAVTLVSLGRGMEARRAIRDAVRLRPDSAEYRRLARELGVVER